MNVRVVIYMMGRETTGGLAGFLYLLVVAARVQAAMLLRCELQSEGKAEQSLQHAILLEVSETRMKLWWATVLTF